MNILVSQTFRNYKNDSIKLFIYKVFDKPFVILIVIYFIVVILNLLNKSKYINFFPDILGLLSFAVGFGIIGMMLYSLIQIFKIIKDINKEAKFFFEGKINIIINRNYISIETDNNSCKVNWNQIKELLVIGKTAYLIPVSKDDFLIRINKKEILEGNFEEVVNLIVSKWKTN